MQTLANAASEQPQIVLRSGDVEQVFDGDVSIAADGQAHDRTAAGIVPLCILRWENKTLQVTPADDAEVRLNGLVLDGPHALVLDDVLRCGAVDVVIDRLVPSIARASIYPLAGNATLPPDDAVAPIAIETPADAVVSPDEALELDVVAERMLARKAGWSTWQAAALAAFLLLAAALLSLLLIQRVNLTLAPDDARVSAPGSWFAWHAGKTIFVFPGEHQLLAERTGYRSARAAVSVARGRDATAGLRLEKLPGLVTIDTGGVPAAVSVDGRPAGQARADIEMAAGARTLTLRADRYLDQIVRVEVVGLGEQQTVAVVMQPAFGIVKLTSEPSGARIAIDGKAAGSTPAALELSAGVRRIRLEASGLRPWESSLVVQAGTETSLGPIELGAADAKLTLRSVPSGAEVLVGGALRGRTPLTVELSPGIEHDISITRAGYDSAQRRVYAEADKTTVLTVRLAPRLVKVRVEGEPAGAAVLVDGEQLGTAPVDLQLPAARHRVEVRKAGFATYATELILAPGLERTLRYLLIDPRNIAGNAPATIETKSGIALKLVAGGVFQMGSGRREQGRRPNEGSRRVTLQRPYYLGVTEVTNAQFRQFRARHDSGFVGRTSLDLDALPVSKVSWNEAVEFCNWLSQQEGLPLAYEQRGGSWVLKTPVANGYRLPTESEWEYAARYAGNAKFRRYSWGDALPLPPNSGNLAGAEASEFVGVVLQDYRDEVAAVAKPRQFSANVLGLYDMSGNVSEWTTDRYSSFVDSSDATDPLGPAEGTQHVVRGANWRTNSVSELRLAWRDGGAEASNTIGFRVARYVAP